MSQVLFADDRAVSGRPAAARALPPRALRCCCARGALLLRLGAVPLLGPDEPRYARVAVEMQRAGEWVTPTLQGQPWLEKPPLYYWLAAPPSASLGETETAARLPSVLARAAPGRARPRSWARASTAPRPACTPASRWARRLLPFAYGRAASMDMLLAACVTAAIGPGRRCACSASPDALALPARGRVRRPGHAGQGPARPAAAGARRRRVRR